MLKFDTVLEFSASSCLAINRSRKTLTVTASIVTGRVLWRLGFYFQNSQLGQETGWSLVLWAQWHWCPAALCAQSLWDQEDRTLSELSEHPPCYPLHCALCVQLLVDTDWSGPRELLPEAPVSSLSRISSLSSLSRKFNLLGAALMDYPLFLFVGVKWSAFRSHGEDAKYDQLGGHPRTSSRPWSEMQLCVL